MVKIDSNPSSGQVNVTVIQALDDVMYRELPTEALKKAVDEIVKQVVDKIVAEKFGEILSKVDTLAIANLSIARCADKIAKELIKDK